VGNSSRVGRLQYGMAHLHRKVDQLNSANIGGCNNRVLFQLPANKLLLLLLFLFNSGNFVCFLTDLYGPVRKLFDVGR
jgi:hypothetical protein